MFRRALKGTELTPVGQAFIDHARAALLQADAALAAARKAAAPARQRFALGFLTGHEIEWLARALQSLRQLAPSIEVTVSSLSSPVLAVAVTRGELDAAFMRAEKNTVLEYRTVRREKLMAVLPASHRLAESAELVARDFADPGFIMPTRTAPVLRDVIDDYARAANVTLPDEIQAENTVAGMSWRTYSGRMVMPPVDTTRDSAIDTAKPLAAPAPAIALVVGFDPGNLLPLLQRFLRSLPLALRSPWLLLSGAVSRCRTHASHAGRPSRTSRPGRREWWAQRPIGRGPLSPSRPYIPLRAARQR